MANCCTTEVKLAICCSKEEEVEISFTFLTGNSARVLNYCEFAAVFEINTIAYWGVLSTSAHSLAALIILLSMGINSS